MGRSIAQNEYSPNAGGLLLWPAKLLILTGFLLLFLQGISEIIKRIAVIRGRIEDPTLPPVEAPPGLPAGE